jgi:hypothetical protein
MTLRMDTDYQPLGPLRFLARARPRTERHTPTATAFTSLHSSHPVHITDVP